MMPYFRMYYLVLIALGIGLYLLLIPNNNTNLSFFGFAESQETEINYNYPVVVDRIFVQPGQQVKYGDTLIFISRHKTRELMEDQDFKINQLLAEERLWMAEKKQRIIELEKELETKTSDIEVRIAQIDAEIDSKGELVKGLSTLNSSELGQRALDDRKYNLEKERSDMISIYNLRILGLREEIRLAKNPYKEQINRLQAEREFDRSQQHQIIAVIAPSDGLIGNISCKEDEHIPAFDNLLTFYEPHSGFISGYVHEKLTTDVALGDTFEIRSLKDESITYPGRVVGLGSRIVEIPARLRKIPMVKSYGREIQIEIPEDNVFLQKEKVGVRFILQQ